MDKNDNINSIGIKNPEEMSKKFFEDVSICNKKEIQISNKTSDIIHGKNKIPECLDGKVSVIAAMTLNPIEFKIYIDEVKKWVEAHPDWNNVEDIEDINNLALEKIMQYRALKKKPSGDSDAELSNSKRRESQYRNNLGAKRSAKNDNYNKNGGINIAILCGKVDEEKILNIKNISIKNKTEEDDLFPVRAIGV
ncbi:MAG: hypothetical protein M0P71_01485 [Melioribacteraceae bacterium]|nr:hypothetical protein [Melioribacteraceae bacterium]